MKRRNFNKSILQQGGLMIEALAMLGLIAVVTPTMYKKSAERTMEVEDINTAATIRTINAAANDYVSANYATILGDMVKNNETNRKLELNDLKTYLPYGFNIEKALYNYNGNSIRISVARPAGSNNLTTLMLFPAKMDADNGIGQERTARIAALIGSSGGYVTDSHKARGIGGIWKLEGDDFTNNFGNADPNTYSIVTASADTISASAGNEMDYSKYLQRGKDAGDDEGQWKNTMRTDLYMGGPEGSSEDVYHEATGPWSIRNIKSLIVGANTSGGKDGDGNDLADVNGYGLYISGDAGNPNKNAYIHGSLEAGNGQLNADENNLKYGTGTDDAGNSWVGFNVNREGTISNLKDLNLAQKFTNGWNSIRIGALDDNDDDDTNYIIRAYHDTNNNTGHVSLLSDSIAQFHSYGSDVYNIDGDNVADNDDRIVFVDGGWKRLGTTNDDKLVEEPKYYNKPYFPMRIGSNVKADGLLAAGQLDTQKIRAASLSVGSQYIDDSEKWLNVDKYGIIIKDVDRHYDGEDYTSTGTYGSFDNNGILLRVSDDKSDTRGITDEDKGTLGTSGGRDTSEHEIQFNLRMKKEFAGGTTLSNVAELFADNTDIRGKEIARISGQGTIIQAKSEIGDWKDDYDNNSEDETQDFKDTVGPNTLLLRNDGMQMKMSSKAGSVKDKNSNDNPINISETVFSPRNNRDSAYTRTSFQNMHVDLKDSNFRIVSNWENIFSVRGNDNEEDKFSSNNNDVFTRNIPDFPPTNEKIINNYDVALHGNIVVAPKTPIGSSSYNPSNYYANVSIGTLNKMAGVNILDKRYDYNGKLSETASSGHNANQHNVVIIDQGFDVNADYNNNNKKDIVDPGTVYIRKGYVEVHGEDTANTSGHSYNDAYHGNGVLVASRLVANNPSPDKTTKTTVPYGHEVPQMFDKKVMEHYGEKVENRYDTYMVNPAYTSVMHDIKLTTRGGARLSDILPDFINKGIYVVNNTYLENTKEDLLFYKKSWSDLKGYEYKSTTDNITLGSKNAWASPYLGAVPAPQCPPGYGRVITLTPSIFEMGQVGNLYKGERVLSSDDKEPNENGYYVLNSKANKGQIEAALTPAQYERTAVSPSTSSGAQVSLENDANPTLGGSYTVKSMDNISTSKYVLSHVVKEDNDHNEIQPLAPVTFQQSTHLKSLTIPLATGDYTQGWATIMGFIYPESLYKDFITKTIEKRPVRKDAANDKGYENTKNYWNIFPVKRGSLQGYATVYCYFDRTNILDKVVKDSGFNGKQKGYIDEYTYMQSMGGNDSEDIPTSYEKKSGSTDYQKRLNDPNMKYDEVW